MYPWLAPGATQAPEAPPPRILTNRGWVTLFPMGIYSNAKGEIQALPLEALVEALLVAESLHTRDRIDERIKVEVTVPTGTAADTSKTTELEVPSDEVWYLNRFNLVTEAEVSGNIRISKFPKTNDVDKKYLGTDQAAEQDISYDLAAAGQLGADLRLVSGDKLTVVATVTAADGTTADRKVTLNIYGRKARRLV